MTKTERQAALKRCSEATPGPWGWAVGSIGGDYLVRTEKAGLVCIIPREEVPEEMQRPNVVFIAAARMDLPAALADIEALETALLCQECNTQGQRFSAYERTNGYVLPGWECPCGKAELLKRLREEKP